MADNSRKTPFAFALHDFAAKKINDAAQILARSWPCSVVSVDKSEIVTVKFEVTSPYTIPNVQIPVATSEYVRLPIQKGDKGVAIAADAYLGGMSGIGGGTATLTPRANLTPLVFVPIGNTGWTTVDNNVLTLYGPNGVTIEDKAANCTIKITKTDITLTVAENDVVHITDGDITITVPTSKLVKVTTTASSPAPKFVKLADNSNSIVLMAQ